MRGKEGGYREEEREEHLSGIRHQIGWGRGIIGEEMGIKRMITFLHYNQLLSMFNSLPRFAEEATETSDSQSSHYQPFPFILMYYSGTFYSPFNISLSLQNMRSHYDSLRNDQEFFQRPSKNIVLHESKDSSPEATTEHQPVKRRGKKHSKKVEKRMPMQKQNRNVLSNILRIFFKSTLQASAYDSLVEAVIRKQRLSVKKEDFYAWMVAFGINYKNYIQNSQMKRMFAPNQPAYFRSILIIVMRHYLKNYGMTHCMTSKKIELKALRMHLSGLKELEEKFIDMYLLAK